MTRTTISLPDDLARALKREARRRRVSLSQVMRDALESRFGRSGSRKLPFVGIGNSGPNSTGRNFEEVLDAEWSTDRNR